MKLKRFRTEEEELPFASMADLAFNLLIFMMVTMISSAMTSEKGLEVFLPAAQSSSELPPKQVIITISRDGVIDLDGKPGVIAGVREYVTSRISNQPGEFVIIRSDRETPYRFIIDVMDELAKGGITRIALPTRQEGEEGGG